MMYRAHSAASRLASGDWRVARADLANKISPFANCTILHSVVLYKLLTTDSHWLQSGYEWRKAPRVKWTDELAIDEPDKRQ